VALRSPKNDTLNGIALCAGVGGLELGLHIAEPGYRTVCYVEREVFPAATLVARMEDKTLDNAPVWDDVKTFDGRPWCGKVHLVTGGYPCQPFSFSGKQEGEKDPRHLWPDIRRIVGEIQPEWCFFENVEGHLDLGAAKVIKDLSQMGFTVKAGMFSALETGASQIRRRLFIMAHADEVPLLLQSGSGTIHCGAEVSHRSDTIRQPDFVGQDRASMDTDLVDDPCLRSGAEQEFSIPIYPPAPHQFAAWCQVLTHRPDLQPEFFGLDDGVANRMDRSDCAGNGVVSLAAANAWRTLKAACF